AASFEPIRAALSWLTNPSEGPRPRYQGQARARAIPVSKSITPARDSVASVDGRASSATCRRSDRTRRRSLVTMPSASSALLREEVPDEPVRLAGQFVLGDVAAV